MKKLLIPAEGRIRLPILKSFLFSLPSTCIFYVLIYPVPILHTWFYERGSMPVFSTVCFFLALFLLGYRLVENKKDMQALALLEEQLTPIGKLNGDSAFAILEELRKKPVFVQTDLTLPRWNRVARHLKSGGHWSDTESLIRTMSIADKDALESAYIPVKFLVWFIPILGFIGTLLGLGAAISGFEEVLMGSKDFEAMKSSLGAITNNLGYAFDTTLVSLFQVAIVMFFLSSVQKQGDNLLLYIDEVFTDDVLMRIEPEPISKNASDSGFSPETLAVLSKFSDSAKHLTALAKLDSFEKVFLNLQSTLLQLSPILANLQKKRALSFKLTEVEED
jgi:hypothetical protein